jgi:secretion/DNA translocation related TadE-like protein
MHRPERGSASVWVLACAALVFAVTAIGVFRAGAVLARHRAEAAADLAALAAAGQIGVSGRACPAARRIAAANGARVRSCSAAMSPDGRSGTVRVRVAISVHLPLVGTRNAVASARAGRDPPG